MGAIMLITLFPLYWILRTALSSNSSLYGGATSWLPTDWNTGSFARVFGIQAGKEALAEGGSGQSIDFWRSNRLKREALRCSLFFCKIPPNTSLK